ncbi:DMT family transporter [Ulvibacter litoralis]|uniref:EamA-like transporter family protein n=1 Tax=Ulvibacter litoralis TaxID=227084 RepID=A0A1G7EUC7_9FLAO|nr:DMT family transporter [Ulvibacter litoralis]GHC53893.1 DMT transporter permease [Ulvibacter litoralis]SDE67211.1 EamA-like transporter family protein [Ulvibacter litoralis]
MLKKAIQYMIISAFAFALLNAFVKNLNQFSVYQIVFFRSIGSLLFTIPYLLRNKISMLGNKKGLLVLRSVFGVISMILFFLSIKFLPMGSAVSIRYTAPIFATVLAFFLLKENIKILQWVCFLIAFLGVAFLKGFDAEVSTIGLMYAIISAIFSGLVFITIRKINTNDHPMVVVNYFMIIAAIVGGVLSINTWVQPKGTEWLFLLGLGVFGYFGQYYMTKALQTSETNLVAPLKYIEVIFTMLIGLAYFKEAYTFWSLIGIGLIITGLVFNIIVKQSKRAI